MWSGSRRERTDLCSCASACCARPWRASCRRDCATPRRSPSTAALTRATRPAFCTTCSWRTIKPLCERPSGEGPHPVLASDLLDTVLEDCARDPQRGAVQVLLPLVNLGLLERMAREAAA